MVEDIRKRIDEALGDKRRSDLARLTGESTANVSRWMRDREPSLVWVCNVAKALGLNGHWLLFGEGPRKAGEADWSLISFDDLSAEYQRRVNRINADVQRLAQALGNGARPTKG